MLNDVLILLHQQHESALQGLDKIESNIVVDILMNSYPALLEVAEAALATLSAADDPSPLEFLGSIEGLTVALTRLESIVIEPEDDPDEE